MPPRIGEREPIRRQPIIPRQPITPRPLIFSRDTIIPTIEKSQEEAIVDTEIAEKNKKVSNVLNSWFDYY